MRILIALLLFLSTSFVALVAQEGVHGGLRLHVIMDSERYFHNDPLYVKMVITNESNSLKSFVIFDRDRNSTCYF